MLAFIQNYLSEAITAIVGVLLSSLWRYLQSGFRKQFYFKIFGGSVSEDGTTSLVYGEFIMHPGIQFPPGLPRPFAYVKPVRTPKVSTNVYSMSKPISSCAIRAATYLTEVFSRDLNVTPKLASDLDLLTTTDINYVAFGGPGSNLKTYDAVFHQDNHLVGFDNQQMWYILDGRILFTGPALTHDYGLIMNVRPSEHANHDRVWIICAGFGEWGTSGSAYYLSRNWKNIAHKYGTKPFAIIVQVESTKDDSAKEVWSSLSM